MPIQTKTSAPLCPVTDWANLELPNAWPDELNWKRPSSFALLLRKVTGKARARVVLPAGLPNAEHIPKYVLQEFHNLPNGNYSKRIGRGYAHGFDHVMLGSLKKGRQHIAAALQGAEKALDLGCGAGHMGAALHEAGIKQIWGLDPSPYLLQIAAEKYPYLQLIHGVGETIDLPDASMDAISVCFVFHEIPPRYLKQVLSELQRVLKPGGKIAVIEPSKVQWTDSTWALWRQYGWRGVYFKFMAFRVFEPFVEAWHKQDFPALLAEYGFEVEQDESGCPFRFVVAHRQVPIAPTLEKNPS